MTSTIVRNSTMGAGPVRALDRLRRRLTGIEEFCQRSDCLFRISLARAPKEVRLADGTHIRRGELFGELHYWNEHMPSLTEGKPALAWALASDRAVRQSLHFLAEFVEADPRYRQV